MILVIDDSPEDLFFHRRLIRKIDPGAAITEFTYAEQALDFIENLRNGLITLILLDINLPRIDGFEFLRRYDTMRQLNGAPKIYVMSGSIDPNDRAAATALASVDGYLSKPLRLAALQKVLWTAGQSGQTAPL
ncbi:MAG: response regulator [Pseudomonadota bacterium]